MDIKAQIKEEPCFQDFCSENERYNKQLVKKVKIDSDIKPELEEGSTCSSQNEEHHLMRFNETIKKSDIESKIDIKEEQWWLEREDPCVHDIKDGTHEDFFTTKQPSLCKEAVSTYTSDSFYSEDVENNVSFNVNILSPEREGDIKYQNQENVIANISSTEASVCAEKSDRKIASMFSCLKQSKLLQQNNTNKQDNMENKSVLNHEHTKSYKSNVSKECFKCTFHFKTCSLVHDSGKVNRCGGLKKSLNHLSLKTQSLIDTRKKTHKCNICNESLTCLEHLITDKVNHEGVKLYQCNTCNKAFSDLSNFKKHKLIHEGIKPHRCNICNSAFTQLSGLKRHKLIHEGLKPHKCNNCNKAFTQLSDLKKHKLIHEGVRPHKCSICNKAFTRLSALKRHKLVHEAIKPYNCDICKKAFTQSSDLKNHKLKHEGVRPHKCSICNKGFTKLSGLKNHKLTHESVRPHKCSICNEGFTQLSGLKRHKLVHEGIKPYNCDICKKAFTQSSALKRHKLIHQDK